MLLPAVVAFLFTTLYVVLCGFALSGEQTAWRDLGRADHRLSVSVSPGEAIASPGRLTDLRKHLGDNGPSESWFAIQTFDVRPDSIPRPLTTGKSRTINYLEGGQLRSLFPTSRELEIGQWPKSPRQVAISSKLRDRLESDGSLASSSAGKFTVFSGAATFEVTGVFVDVFSESSLAMVAAPGTWASLPSEIADNFTGTGAVLSAYWKGEGDAESVASALVEASETETSSDELLTGLLNRRDWIGSDDVSLVDSASFIFTLPFISLVIAGVAVAARSSFTWCRRAVGTMVNIGLRRRRVAAVFTLLTVGYAAAASISGVLAGTALGALARLTIVPAIAQQPVGPIRDLTPVVLTGLAGAIFVVPAVFAPLWARGTGKSSLKAAAAAVPWNLLRWLAIVVLLARSAFAVANGHSDAESAGLLIGQVVAATILLVPDLLRVLTNAVPIRGPRTLLTKRLMQSDRSRFAVMGIVVAVSVAAPTAASTFVATSTRTEAAGNISQVPHGQLWIDRSEGVPAAEASQTVAKHLGSRPITLGATLAFTQGDTDANGPTQVGIRTVESADALRTLLGSAMTERHADLLADGGALLISGTHGRRSVQIQDGTSAPADLPISHAVVRGVAPELQGEAAGFILNRTAAALNLQVVPALDAYPGIKDQDIRSAVDLVQQRGQDTHSLQYHVVPDKTTPSREWYVALVGLLCVSALVLGALISGHADHIRQYGARLVSLGLARRWTRTVGLSELAIMLAGAGVAAVVASVSAIAILANGARAHLILDIPWGFIACVVVTSLGLCLAVFAATIRSRPEQARSTGEALVQLSPDSGGARSRGS